MPSYPLPREACSAIAKQVKTDLARRGLTVQISWLHDSIAKACGFDSVQAMRQAGAAENARRRTSDTSQPDPYHTVPKEHLQPLTLPPPGEERSLYIKRLALELCPDSNAHDSFWSKRARNALTGLLHFAAAAVDPPSREFFQDRPSWSGLPQAWKTRAFAPALAIEMLDQLISGGFVEEREDLIANILKTWRDDACTMQNLAFRSGSADSPTAARGEIETLKNMPPKTRCSVLMQLAEVLMGDKTDGACRKDDTFRSKFRERLIALGKPIPNGPSRAGQPI